MRFRRRQAIDESARAANEADQPGGRVGAPRRMPAGVDHQEVRPAASAAKRPTPATERRQPRKGSSAPVKASAESAGASPRPKVTQAGGLTSFWAGSASSSATQRPLRA